MGVHSTCTVCMLVCVDGVKVEGLELLTVAVSAVCLRCLTSVAEHVDETVARGD